MDETHPAPEHQPDDNSINPDITNNVNLNKNLRFVGFELETTQFGLNFPTTYTFPIQKAISGFVVSFDFDLNKNF